MKNDVKWLWVSRILMIAAAVGIITTSYFFYEPRNFPLGHVSPQLGQLIMYGGLVALVTAFTWFWPEVGGIIAMIVGSFYLWRFDAIPGVMHLTRTPAPLYYVLYGIFTGSGILNLYAGLIRKPVPYTLTASDKRLQLMARVIASTTIAIFIIVYIFIYPPLIFYAMLSLIIVTTAWFWPAPGGILMLVIGLLGFYPLITVGWEMSWKWPIYILLTVFIVSAIMHLIVAWRIRKLRLAFTGDRS
jgi:hypothetical protein